MRIIVFIAVICFFSPVFAQVEYAGVNLAGAEFGDGTLPGTVNRDYVYPTHEEVDYFTSKGMNTFRVPFKWERMQRTLNGELDADELSYMDDFVEYATSKEAYVVLDPHNYARWYGEIIGTDAVPVSAFGDFWSRLASHYKDNSYVIFGIMNEPYDMSTELWLEDANVAIQAIRRTGAHNLLLVPGNAWTGGHSWTHDWYGTPNAEVMLGIVDSLDNYAYEIHQYLDSDYSGTSPECITAAEASEKLIDFTNWAKENGKRAFLGEFGVADNSNCYEALEGMLDYMYANNDVWMGWTWWAAGPWWSNYIFLLEPGSGGEDKPQMSALEPYINPVLIESIVLTGDAEMAIGSQQSLTAEIGPESHTISTLTWSSSDTDVVTVDAEGTVSAVALGTADITSTASDGSEVSASFTISVTPVLVESLSISGEPEMNPGDTQVLIATAAPDEATDPTVSWASSDADIATVDESGMVTAIAEGTVEIIATANDGSEVSASFTVNVGPVLVESVAITGNAEMQVEETQVLSATVTPGDAADQSVVWSSANTSIATVDQTGLVTAIAVGTVDIVATASDASGATSTFTLTVNPILLESVSINGVPTMIVGETQYVTVTTAPDNAADETVSWSSSDPEIATVDYIGFVSALAEGEVVLTALANDGSGTSATFSLTINATPLPLGEQVENLLIWPNPTSELLYLEVPAVYGAAVYSIYDVSGKLIQSNTLVRPTTVDVSDFEKGIYVIEIKGEKDSTTRRVVVE